VLHYLARYTHRVAISNHRLVNFSDGKVTFRWKDYSAGGQQKLVTLTANEFPRRFLLHTLPRGFVRIRFFETDPFACHRSPHKCFGFSYPRSRQPTIMLTNPGVSDCSAREEGGRDSP